MPEEKADDEYEVIEIELDQKQIDDLQDLSSGEHKHIQVNKNKEIIIHKK